MPVPTFLKHVAANRGCAGLREVLASQLEGPDTVHETTSPKEWTFLSNHGHVMVALGRDPHARVRDIAVLVGITERAVQAILVDLEEEGYLTRERVGRRNQYQLHPDRAFRHPAEADRPVRDLLEIFTSPDDDPLPVENCQV